MGPRSCFTCRHDTVHMDDYPCCVCNDHNNMWELRNGALTCDVEARWCDQCKNWEKELNEYPCDICNGINHDKWEPKEP